MGRQRVRHILSLSGGKDSTALAIYLRDRIPDLQYVFCDTGMELPETYDYLPRLEAYLGRPIEHVQEGRGFEHWLDVYGRYLPSARTRWCTRHLKIEPFERLVGDHHVFMYIGIRADEDRVGYISHGSNITAVYPFKEDGIVERDVLQLLEDSGLELPSYYRWRSRSGCYLCFFQRKVEWVGLYEHHLALFERAKRYEELAQEAGCPYTWSQRESLEELSQPKRVEQIKRDHARRMAREERTRPNRTVWEVFQEAVQASQYEAPCDWCHG